MIERIVLQYLMGALSVPVYTEQQTGATKPFIVLEKTGSSGGSDFIKESTIAIQSYGNTMAQTASLNESVKAAMDNIISLNAITQSKLNSDYNYTDTTKKQFRYQAVYNLTHY